MPRSPFALAALFAAALPAAAQDRVTVAPRAGGVYSFFPRADADKARLGVSIGTADTAGIRVASVVADGPAAKAGVQVGDHLIAIDGVELRVSRADADDPAAGDIVTRRLTRHLDAGTPGAEVTLRVVRDGAPRTIRVTTVRGDALVARAGASGRRGDDRATLGLSLGGIPGKRDTLGVFVVGVIDGGPADRAGIVEGDRIAAIGSVSLRVDPADAGDSQAASARVARLTRELGRVTAGDVVELTVVRDGRSRAARVTTAKASEVADVGAYIRSDGQGPAGVMFPRMRPGTPEVRVFRTPDGGRIELELERDAREEVERAMERVRSELRRVRPEVRVGAPTRRAVSL